MELTRKLGIYATALILAWSGVSASGGGGPLAEPMAPGDLAGVAGGDCVTDGTTNCQASTASCTGQPAVCTKAGVACAGTSYVNFNPTYPTVKAGNGRKSSKPAAQSTLCAGQSNCGPACVNSVGQGGLICPITGSINIWQLGTVPDPDSDACNEEVRLERPAEPLERAVLFAVNGGLFNAFH